MKRRYLLLAALLMQTAAVRANESAYNWQIYLTTALIKEKIKELLIQSQKGSRKEGLLISRFLGR